MPTETPVPAVEETASETASETISETVEELAHEAAAETGDESSDPARDPLEGQATGDDVGGEDVDGDSDGDAEAGSDSDDSQDLIDPELLLPAIEAMLFVSDHPIRVQQVCATLRSEFDELRAPSVRAALRELQRRYQDPARGIGRGFELVEVDKGFVFRSHPDHSSFLQRFGEQKPQKLSRAALETLSVVAYRQPATRPQVEEVRGVDSSSALKVLLDRGLVRVLGKSEEVGRPLLYGTTPEFLELFGLKSLAHLPTLQEYQELDPEHQAKVEEQHGKPQVKVADLVAEDQAIVSDETETDSSSALQDLEDAVELADSHRKAVEASLKPTADVPPESAQAADVQPVSADVGADTTLTPQRQDPPHGD